VHLTSRKGDVVAAEKLLRHGHPAAALAELQQILVHDPDDVRALRGACLSLARLGRLDDAARVCRRAIDRAPDDLEARRTLATIYYSGGAYKWSAAEWRHVVERAPRDAHARRALRAAERLSSKG
jgi:Flp pilus assembly protein TadD